MAFVGLFVIAVLSADAALGLTPAVPGECPASSQPPLPSSECCGRENVEGTKVSGRGRVVTTIDNYPWMALIGYSNKNETSFRCLGALVSSRYVLTAAHCLVSGSSPTSVRLGEYDLSKAIDCVETDSFSQDCNNPVVDISIERFVAHPQFERVEKNHRNDIGLIRLNKDAPYTDFIRPICLPTNDVTLTLPDKSNLWLASWHLGNAATAKNNIKVHVDLPFTPQDQCQVAYSGPSYKVQFWNKQLCAGGVGGNDACAGDGGGPLMYENGKTFEVVGIVSFGPKSCGVEGIPGVYTKVFEYSGWIKSEMQ